MGRHKTPHNKYTNKARYSELVAIRLDAYQALALEELCTEYGTTKTAIIRLAINKLIREVNLSQE